jgi:hypothetical protein
LGEKSRNDVHSHNRSHTSSLLEFIDHHLFFRWVVRKVRRRPMLGSCLQLLACVWSLREILCFQIGTSRKDVEVENYFSMLESKATVPKSTIFLAFLIILLSFCKILRSSLSGEDQWSMKVDSPRKNHPQVKGSQQTILYILLTSYSSLFVKCPKISVGIT